MPSQRVGVVPEHPLAQRYVDAPASVPSARVQSGVGSAQTVAQAPQWAGVARSTSQPSNGLVEQWVRPARHPDKGLQALAVQRIRAASTPGRVVQSVAQVPQ